MMPFGRISKYTPATPVQSVKLEKSSMAQTFLKMPRISNFKSDSKIESQEKISEHHSQIIPQPLIDKVVHLQEQVAAVNQKAPIVHVVQKYGRKQKNNKDHEQNVGVNSQVINVNVIKQEPLRVNEHRHTIDRKVPIFKKSKQFLVNQNNEDPQILNDVNNSQQPITDTNINNFQQTQLQNKQSLSVHLDQQNEILQTYEKQLAMREFKQREEMNVTNEDMNVTNKGPVNNSNEHEVKNQADSARFNSVLSSQQIKQNQSNFYNHSSQLHPNITQSVNQNDNHHYAQKEVYSPTREFQVHTLPSFEPIEIPINS